MDCFITKNYYRVVSDKRNSQEHRIVVLTKELLDSNREIRSLNRRYWIDVMGNEAEICKKVFGNKEREFYLEMGPKTINLRKELAKLHVPVPPRFNLSYPNCLRRTKEMEEKLCLKEAKIEKKKGLEKGTLTERRHQRELRYKNLYFIRKRENRENWEKYNSICYKLIHEDIAKQRKAGAIFKKVNVVFDHETDDMFYFKVEIN